MPISRLLIPAVCIATAATAAGAQSQQAPQPSAAASLAQMPIMTGELSPKSLMGPPKAQVNSNLTGSACYSIRDYKFSRANPDSNVMKPSGYSECEPASSYRLEQVFTPHK